MIQTSRPTPDQFAQAGWADLQPWYDDLATRPLDRTTVDGWLAAWSALEEALEEARGLAWIAHTLDTTDPAKESAQLRFAGEIAPRREEQGVRLTNRLLDLDYTRPDLETMLRRFRNRRDLFRAANIPLQEELEELNARYSRLTGGMTVFWEGEELPLPLLEPFLLDSDRTVRERAFRLRIGPFVEVRDELAGLFNDQYALRQQIARNAGSEDFRDYAFRDFNRFEYTTADCETFHEAVATTVVPALGRRRARRREQLKLETLRPWDTGPDPLGRPPLRPFTDGDELASRAETVFARLDPDFGSYFATMAREGLLDLDSRTGKQPLGYSTDLPFRRRPFIFMNAAGVAQDVTVLLHEAGHSFHSFESYALPLVFQRDPGSEMGEVGSMAMELLAAPYLGRAHGGFYHPEEEGRARAEHLENILDVLTFIAQGDAFQHWIYTSGEGHDAAARDAAWRRLSARFDVGVDWNGLETEQAAGWYRVPHFFMIPFYFIEYGIAQIGALQIWLNSKDDERAAVAAYRRALALGGTKPLPELFAAAGARLAFDAETMGELVGAIEEELAILEG